MPTDFKLEKIRIRIDEIDEQLISLISERASLATEVTQIKRDSGKDGSFYRPEREAKILRRIIGLNKGPLSEQDITRLFREIMSSCLALEQQLNIVYLGPEGTFTQTAALKHFGHSVNTFAKSTIGEVFREVESRTCQYGLVPIENSIGGMVNHTHDMLTISNLKICGEVKLRVHQNLMSKADNTGNLNKIYSHQQSLEQCRTWLDEHLVSPERISVYSNAEAAKLAVEDPNGAVIAGESAAEFYQLNILERNIEDIPNNTTRFLVIGNEDVPASDNDKTSLIFTTANKPGALHKMLACFSEYQVSLMRIESRPSREVIWDYIFFVDIEGHIEDDAVAKALKQLRQQASMVKILGSYPSAVL